MKIFHTFRSFLILLAAGLALPAAAPAGPDQFIGDAAIYSGKASKMRPNVLLIVDNSMAAGNFAPGGPYYAKLAYTGAYSRCGIYAADQQGDFSLLVADNTTIGVDGYCALENLTCTLNGNIAKTNLNQVGTYSGQGTSTNPNLKAFKGKAECDLAPKGAQYALGNYLNYLASDPAGIIVRNDDPSDPDNPRYYILLQTHIATSDNAPGLGLSGIWEQYWAPTTKTCTSCGWLLGFEYVKTTTSITQKQAMYHAIKSVVSYARETVNFGFMTYGPNNAGGYVVYPVQDIRDTTKFNWFLSQLPGSGTTAERPLLSSMTARPQAEALWDAGKYFAGMPQTFMSPAQLNVSPIKLACDKNYVILITNGLPNKENMNALAALPGDYDNDSTPDGPDKYAIGDGGTHYLDDVARYLFMEDLLPLMEGKQRIITGTILAFKTHDPLIERAAQASWEYVPADSTNKVTYGKYFNVTSTAQLAKALLDMLTDIMQEADTSFVAPVVPVAPENRTYSGSRVYMGFFQPLNGVYWYGNIKKYGLDENLDLIDVNKKYATWLDANGDGKDDRSAELLPDGKIDGSFRDASQSHWSSAADGYSVDTGGAGEVLRYRDLATSPRSIYTFRGTNVYLSNSANLFNTTNITPTNLGLAADDYTGRDQLVSFMQGYDAYGSDPAKARSWPLGDVIHSRPLIVNYSTFNMTYPANEKSCTTNRNMVFAGANDGMLHAFRDCDGAEVWAFVPPNIWQDLYLLKDGKHAYYVDSSIKGYIYDKDNNQTISGDDRVLLLFGQRRGGARDWSPTIGNYYIIDVTYQNNPRLLARINPWGYWAGGNLSGPVTYYNNPDMAELGEAWSEPAIVRVKLADGDHIVAFFGAGYDNCNEDARYGNTQKFSGACVVGTSVSDEGAQTSSGTVMQKNARGRGVFMIDIAKLDATGKPDTTTAGKFLWKKAFSDDAQMEYAVPSDIAVIDGDYNGYADRIYFGDTGGVMWRGDIGDKNTVNWTVRKLFSSIPGMMNGTADGSQGRKIQFRPAVTVEGEGQSYVCFGSGDREHPLNTAVTDRIYCVIDRGQLNTKYEFDLVDVTEDMIQAGDTAQRQAVIDALADPNKYGWYIRLDEYAGEKTVAPAGIFAGVMNIPTWYPNPPTDVITCDIGNTGQGSMFMLNYKTGEAILNANTANDQYYDQYKWNSNATPNEGTVTIREDRRIALGAGLPSQGTYVTSASGETALLISQSGNVKKGATGVPGGILPIYWRQK